MTISADYHYSSQFKLQPRDLTDLMNHLTFVVDDEVGLNVVRCRAECKGQYGVGVGVGVGGVRGFMEKEDSKTGVGDSAAISV